MWRDSGALPAARSPRRQQQMVPEVTCGSRRHACTGWLYHWPSETQATIRAASPAMRASPSNGDLAGIDAQFVSDTRLCSNGAAAIGTARVISASVTARASRQAEKFERPE